MTDNEKVIAESNDLSGVLLDSIGEGVAHYGGVFVGGRLDDLRVLDINIAGARLSGMEREAQIGRTWKELWPTVDPAVFEHYNEVHQRRATVRFEHESPFTDRWYDVSISPVGEHEFIVIFSDITDRKRVEATNRAALDDLAAAQQLCHIGHWSFDVKTGVVRWSDELYRIFDVPPGQFGGLYESFINCVHPDDRAMVIEANRTARVAGTSFQIDYRIIRQRRDVRVIREIGHSVRDEDGAVVRLFGVAQDVTNWEPLRVGHSESRRRKELRDVA